MFRNSIYFETLLNLAKHHPFFDIFDPHPPSHCKEEKAFWLFNFYYPLTRIRDSRVNSPLPRRPITGRPLVGEQVTGRVSSARNGKKFPHLTEDFFSKYNNSHSIHLYSCASLILLLLFLNPCLSNIRYGYVQ